MPLPLAGGPSIKTSIEGSRLVCVERASLPFESCGPSNGGCNGGCNGPSNGGCAARVEPGSDVPGSDGGSGASAFVTFSAEASM